nr:T-complex protein 1 subunit gamma [Danaus plexippus plexippus]
MYGQQPILVLSQNTKRESGRKVQLENINAGKTIADVIRTCLGPQAMLKMLMDPMGGIVMTNDGNAILREITVQHPAAKSMIEIARTQDEEVRNTNLFTIVYKTAVETAIFLLRIDDIVSGSKKKNKEDIHYINYYYSYAKVEKIPGGSVEESKVLNGVMFNKDVTHPKMRRYIENPRIILLDCPLEYKKGESQTNIEIVGEQDFTKLLQLEEEHVQRLCEDIIALKPDVVVTEKGVSDLAQHYLVKAGITAIRRLRKTDNNRLARACGATIVNRTEELKESDVGTQAGRFEIKKIGDDYFTFVTECKNPKACTILLRGASKDILNEIERNLQDALHVAKNLVLNPRLVCGGGAVEMSVSGELASKAHHAAPYRAVAQALEIIPRTLAQNCGANTIRTLTALRAKHAAGERNCGIDGETGLIVDMAQKGIWEPLAVKLQVYKTAVETAIFLLRIDDIVSGSKKKNKEGANPAEMANMQE